MAKYLHKPKLKNIIIFIIVVAVCILSNICFLLIKNDVISYNVDFVLALHFVTPLSYLLLIVFTFNYILLCVEKAISFLENKKQIRILNVYSDLDIWIGILFIIVIFVLGIINSSENNIVINIFIASLDKSVYFDVLNTSEDITSIYQFWLLIPLFLIISCSISFFCSSSRKNKRRKFVVKTVSQIEYQEKRNQEFGFIYEESEFYRQVNIPYYKLNQKDGTRGEFEAYRVLVNSGLTDVEYLFNREIPKEDGLLTELDIIILNKNGIVVLENKDYSTRIFGKSTDDTLTIIDHSGKKMSIYNPILQNKKHVMCLKAFLAAKGLYVDDSSTPIYSVVVFTDTISNKSDDIISGIEICDDSTKICTSQNLSYVVKNLLANNDKVNIDITKINYVLSSLTIREKY